MNNVKSENDLSFVVNNRVQARRHGGNGERASRPARADHGVTPVRTLSASAGTTHHVMIPHHVETLGARQAWSHNRSAFCCHGNMQLCGSNVEPTRHRRVRRWGLLALGVLSWARRFLLHRAGGGCLSKALLSVASSTSPFLHNWQPSDPAARKEHTEYTCGYASVGDSARIISREPHPRAGSPATLECSRVMLW